MPSRIFDQLDLINIVEGYTNGPFVSPILNLVFNNSSYGNFSFSILGSDSQGPPGVGGQYSFAYSKAAEIDFTIFPTIPDGAKVTRALVTLSFSIAIDISAQSSSPSGSDASAHILAAFPETSPPTPIIVDDAVGPGGTALAEAVTGFSASNTPTIDLTFDPPINLVDFIATYGTFLPNITTNAEEASGGAHTGGSGTASMSLAFNWAVSNWRCEVFYDDPIFKFDINTESPVDVGEDINITAHDFNLKKITRVIVDYTTLDNVDHEVEITDFTTQTEFLLIFQMIDFGDAPKVTISLESTEFSGRVSLGDLLTIRFNDGTGIYKLDLTATHDTLYIQDYTPVQTVDVKIPNPLAKTAFVP